jgi:hypothetical protein
MHRAPGAPRSRRTICAEVFETCQGFRRGAPRLERTPVARPVIYTLVGCERGGLA